MVIIFMWFWRSLERIGDKLGNLIFRFHYVPYRSYCRHRTLETWTLGNRMHRVSGSYMDDHRPEHCTALRCNCLLIGLIGSDISR